MPMFDVVKQPDGPFDPMREQLRLQQQQKILDALSSQGQINPNGPVTGISAVASILKPLAEAFGQKRQNQQSLEYMDKYRQGSTDQLLQLLAGNKGTAPGTAASEMPPELLTSADPLAATNPGASMPTPGQAPQDPYQRIVAALASPYDEVRKLAGSQLTEYNKAPEAKVVGDELLVWDPQTHAYKRSDVSYPDYVPVGGGVWGMAGSEPGHVRGKPIFEPKGSNVSVNVGDNQWEKSGAQGGVDILKTGKEKGDALVNGTQGLLSARDALQRGINTGAGADIRTAGQGIANALGIELDPEKYANTQDYLASVMQAAIPQAKQLGVNPTDFDFKNVMAANGGDVNKAYGAILRTLNKAIANNANFIGQHNRKVDETAKNAPGFARAAGTFKVDLPGLSDNDPYLQQDAKTGRWVLRGGVGTGGNSVAPGGANPAVPSVLDLLKSKGLQ